MEIHSTDRAHNALADYLRKIEDREAALQVLGAVGRRIEMVDRDPSIGAPIGRTEEGFQRRAVNVMGSKLQMHYAMADNGDVLIYNFTQAAQVRDLNLAGTKLHEQREAKRDELRELTDDELRSRLRSLAVERDDLNRRLLATSPASAEYAVGTERARQLDVAMDNTALETRERLVNAVHQDRTGHLERCTRHMADNQQQRTAVMRGLEQRHRLLDIDHADMSPRTADRVLEAQRKRVRDLQDRRLQRGVGRTIEVGF